MNVEEKLAIYRSTLEQIVLSGHALKSIKDLENAFSCVVELARSSLEKAGDI